MESKTKSSTSKKVDACTSKPEEDEAPTSEEELECAVCLQTCVHPVCLPCSHIFCFLCVKGVANQSKRCAMCRQEIPADFLDNPNLLKKIEEKESCTEGYQWFYEGRNGWWQYDSRTNEILEEALQSNLPSVTLLIASHNYILDVQNKIQFQQNDPTKCRWMKRELKVNCTTVAKKGVAGISNAILKQNRSAAVTSTCSTVAPTSSSCSNADLTSSSCRIADPTSSSCSNAAPTCYNCTPVSSSSAAATSTCGAVAPTSSNCSNAARACCNCTPVSSTCCTRSAVPAACNRCSVSVSFSGCNASCGGYSNVPHTTCCSRAAVPTCSSYTTVPSATCSCSNAVVTTTSSGCSDAGGQAAAAPKPKRGRKRRRKN